MEQLKETAFNNLQILVDLKDTETITCHRREIQKQDEYVQVDNISELEYALFFTIHYLLTMEYDENIDRNDLLDDIDLAIDHIYKNTNISKIAEENDVFWGQYEDSWLRKILKFVKIVSFIKDVD